MVRLLLDILLDCMRLRKWSGLKGEVFAEVYLANLLICDDFFRIAFRDDLALIQNIGPVTNAKRFSDIMFGDEDANATIAQMIDDFLDVDDGKRVYSRKGFVEEHEPGFTGQGACNFHASAFAAGQADGGLAAQVGDAEFLQQFFYAQLRLAAGEIVAQFQDGAKIVRDRQFAKDRRLLGQIA